MDISTAHRAARNQASLDLANTGTGPASIKLFDGQGGALLAQRTLAAPCGEITPEGRIALLPATTTELVQATGAVAWAQWCDGNGVAIASGAVTDAAGVGPFKLAGTTGTMVYAGGIVMLATPALLG